MRVGCCASLLVLATGLPASADEPPEPRASTVQRLASTLHGQLAELLSGQPRGSMDLGLCIAAPGERDAGPARLAGRLEALLSNAAAREGWRSVAALAAAPCALTLEQARPLAQERAVEIVLHVRTEARDGRLHLEGTVLRTDRSLWREIAGGRAGSIVGQVFASARLDAELRFYLGTPHPPLSKRSAAIWHETTGTVLALAAGDLDGDDLDELVVLRRDGLDVIAARGPGPRASLRASLDLAALPPAGVASRDPVGSLALVERPEGGRRIALRTSDQAHGALVSWDGSRFGPLEPLALEDGTPAPGAYPVDAAGPGLLCAILPAGRNVFETRTLPCGPSPRPPPATAGAPFWAVSFASVLRPDGASTRVVALASADAKLFVTTAGATEEIGATGSCLLAADLDDDGLVEIARAAPVQPGQTDQVTVTTIEPSAPPRDVWTSRVGLGPITSFAAGDLDGDGTIELLWAERHRSGSRVWVLDGGAEGPGARARGRQ